MATKWERFSGRAAYATKAEYNDKDGTPTIELDIATEMEGETLWRRCIFKRDCWELADSHVRKGTRVMIEGDSEMKSKPDKSGKLVGRWITWVRRLVVDDSEALDEASTPSTTKAPAESTPESDYQRFRETMKATPPRFAVDLPETPRPEDLIDISPEEVKRLIQSLV